MQNEVLRIILGYLKTFKVRNMKNELGFSGITDRINTALGIRMIRNESLLPQL